MSDVGAFPVTRRFYKCRVCGKRGTTTSKARRDCDKHKGLVARERARNRRLKRGV